MRPRLVRHIVARLGSDKSGVALLEFAFMLPIILMVSLTGAEMTNYITTKMRVSQLALQLADNAARMGNSTSSQAKKITEADINDLFTGAQLQSGEIDLTTNAAGDPRRISSRWQAPTRRANSRSLAALLRDEDRTSSTYGTAGQTNLAGMGPTGATLAPGHRAGR